MSFRHEQVSMAQWHSVGPGIWTREYPPFRMNVGLVLGEAECLLIDTRATEREGWDLRHDVSEVTTLPVTTVVNTHAHFDHCFGNAAFPEAPIWGHDECRRVLDQFGESERSYWASRVDGLNVDDLRNTTIIPPTRTFTDAATLEVGEHRVELRFLGRGHTDHDIVVVLPDTGIVFAGDLIEEGSPPWFEDSWPLEWPTAADHLLDLASESYVPGHGAPMTRDEVAQQGQDLRALAELARAVLANEISAERATVDSPFPAEETGIAIERARATIAGYDRRGWERSEGGGLA